VAGEVSKASPPASLREELNGKPMVQDVHGIFR